MSDRLHDLAPEMALDWHRAGKGAALATVIETWNSAPRPVGSQLAISSDGEIIGSVSGGCVEGAVVAEALEALTEGKPRILTYGISDESAFSVGLACGGTIRVLVEPLGDSQAALPPPLLADLTAARAALQAIALVSSLDGRNHTLVRPGEDAAVDARFRLDRSGLTDDGRFIAIHNPPLQLIVVGAVHVAAPLLAMAKTCGYRCTLIDPRSAFGSTLRFPGEAILDDWPDAAIRSLQPDARTAIVTLTHDPKIDDPAILAGLGSPVFYIGCLGSSRTHAKRLERLAVLGVGAEALARLHGPVGLRIGAVTPAEIAVSIMAEMTQVLRKASQPKES